MCFHCVNLYLKQDLLCSKSYSMFDSILTFFFGAKNEQNLPSISCKKSCF